MRAPHGARRLQQQRRGKEPHVRERGRAVIVPVERDYSYLIAEGLSIDDLFSGTFQSVLRIEQGALDNRYTRSLTITDVHTCVAVGLYEKNPMNVVASRLGITTATLTSAINKLERLGFVQRERCSTDRRTKLVSLTTKGRKVWRAHRLFHKRMLKEALDPLSPEEQRVLAIALSKVKGFFDARSTPEAAASLCPAGTAPSSASNPTSKERDD